MKFRSRHNSTKKTLWFLYRYTTAFHPSTLCDVITKQPLRDINQKITKDQVFDVEIFFLGDEILADVTIMRNRH